MTLQHRPVTEQELHAYIDGQLDALRHAEVEAYIEQHPEIKQKVTEYASYNQGLHDLFDNTLQEPIPESLTARTQRKTNYRPVLQMAAMLSALVVGSMLGWITRGNYDIAPHPTLAMVNDAFASYAVYSPEVRHPVEVTQDQEQHLFNWLSKRIDAKVRAPDLKAQGYSLLGGRLLSSEGKPAAQFMYENPQGQRLVLFVRHKRAAESQTAFHYAARNNVQGFYWIDGNLGFALIGEIDKAAISNVAHTVYQELNR